MHRPTAAAAAVTCSIFAHTIHAEGLLDLRSGSERLRESTERRVWLDEPVASDLEQGQWWLTAIGGSSISLGVTTDSFAGLQATKFVIDRLEAGWEVASWGITQDGQDAGGLSASGLIRYHAWDFGKGTVFADAGLGMLFTNDVTPQDGTSANFIPRIGAGVSFRTSETSRFLFGARWHHISNARVFGDDNNPSRDEVMLFAGFQWKL